MANKIIHKDLNSTDKMMVTFNWGRWLGSSSIDTSTWSVKDKSGSTTSTITISDDSTSSPTTTAYISGGSLDDEYWLGNTIITDDAVPRTETRWAEVRVVRKLV